MKMTKNCFCALSNGKIRDIKKDTYGFSCLNLTPNKISMLLKTSYLDLIWLINYLIVSCNTHHLLALYLVFK